jgi:hypothetical protein
MSEQGKFEAEAIAASLEFHEALRAFFDKYNVHAAVVCWATGAGGHVVSITLGCPHCGGVALAHTVYNLDSTWRESFAEAFRDQLQGRSNTKVIHMQMGSETVH